MIQIGEMGTLEFNVMLRRLLWIAITMATITLASPALAQAAGDGIGPYRHDRWSSYDGAPTSVSAIAQTPDGWIWLAAQKGLYRFDGRSFERIAPARGSRMEHAPATALLVTRSGDLWVGYGHKGGMAIFRNGSLRPVEMPHRPISITSIAETLDGAIWVMSDASDYPSRNRLQRWAHGRWEQADISRGLPDGAPLQLCLTPDGTLWALLGYIGGTRLVALRPHTPRFDNRILKVDEINCHVDRQGRLWTAGRQATRIVANADGTVASPTIIKPPPNHLENIASDRAGNIWATTTGGKGIHLLASPMSIDAAWRHFTNADGLTSDVTLAVFVDRDDNVWISTEEGVDRFRRSAAIQETTLPGESSHAYGLSVVQGKIYVGSREGLFEVTPGRSRKRYDQENWGQCPARDGGIWLLFPTTVVHILEGRQKSFARPAEWILTTECAEDRTGRLWVADVKGNLFWHDEHGWHTPARPLPKVFMWDLVLSRSGDLAYMTQTSLVRVVGSKIISTSLARYGLGTFTNISAGQRDLFVSGANGLLRIRDGRISRLDAERFPWVAGLRSIAQTPHGETWLMENNSLSNVATSDLDRAFNHPQAPLYRRFFDIRDGIKATQRLDFRGLQMAVDGAGRVWQLNRLGISYIDRARLAIERPPPPVFIRSLQTADTFVRDPLTVVLPPGTSSINLGYTALSFAFPDRVRFRYRLTGVDKAWVDAGSCPSTWCNFRCATGLHRLGGLGCNL